MSTKTTFKRIALVTVAALGFGVLTSVAPASAAGNAASASFGVNATKITFVDGSANTGGDSRTAVVRITVSDILGVNDSLTANETLTATVVGVPAIDSKTLALSAGDITLKSLKNTGTLAAPVYAVQTAGPTDGSFSTASAAFTDFSADAIGSVYYLGINAAGSGTAAAVGKGYYTIRIRLVDNTGFVLKTQDVQVRYVADAASAEAVLTPTVTGSVTKGAAYTFTALNKTQVTLASSDASVIQAQGSALNPAAPTISGALITTATGVAVATGTINVADTGVSTVDYTATTPTSYGAAAKAFDGTYGVYTSATTDLDTATAGTTQSWRFRYGTAQATAAVTVYAAGGASTSYSAATATGTGLIDGGSGAWSAPLTTKTVVVTALLQSAASTPVADYPLTFTTTWTAAAGDVTPVSGSTGASVVKTDAAGKASITLTYATPLDGKSATVAVTGGGATFTSQVITWVKSKPASFIVDTTYRSSALKGSNKITYTLVDAYGLPVAGEVVSLGLSGANNALGTATIPSATTDANGQVSYTVTDAAALTTESDVLTATSTTVTSVTKGVTIYYLTTAPVIAAMTGYYALDEYAAFSGTLVPSTVIGVGAPLDINQAQDLTASFTKTAAVESQLAIRYSTFTDAAKATTAKGVAVTVTASAGGWILDDAGKPQTSRVIYSSSTGLVLAKVTATTPGEKTFTFTAGTVTGSAVVEFENTVGDTRNVTVTAGANNAKATANAAALPSFTAVVTDKLGNAVSGAVISVVATGVGRLATGGKSAQWTTDSSGSYTFELASTEAGTASVAVSVSTGTTANQTADKAGYVGTTVIGDAKAGNSTSTSTVTFAEGTNAAEANAQAASDAAAEATDAANAATDAANAAAEAADAATAAAQDAADAVAALSAQVATLISGLKAQLTALTNLVIKIQKKVKA
jgi:hypothetical protein